MGCYHQRQPQQEITMKKTAALCLLFASLLCAQNPNLSGVWKANVEKSKGIPPQGGYVVIIEQTDTKLNQNIGMYSQRGENRSALSFNLDGKEGRGAYMGLPLKSKTSWEGRSLIADWTQPNTKAHEKYTLSEDGNTLTVEQAINANGRDTERLLVLEKQPDSAGDALRKPEEKASEHFKNVQIMKDAPASAVMNAMRGFTMSLGVECGQCHAQGDFSSDAKPEKVMARKMMTMTAAINQQAFEGKNEIRCFTCHQGHAHPQGSPKF
jgi:hypothetical protein